jgi:toxin FitB
MNLVDSSGWIAYFFEGANASVFAQPIEDTDHLVVPAICLYEVYKKVYLVADQARALRAIAQMKLGRVVPLEDEIALLAAQISLTCKLPMADSIIYATGQYEGAVVWTQDADFRGLSGVRFVEAQPVS